MPARWGPTHVGSSRCMMTWAYSLNTCNLDMQFEHVQSGHAIWTGEEGMTHRSWKGVLGVCTCSTLTAPCGTWCGIFVFKGMDRIARGQLMCMAPHTHGGRGRIHCDDASAPGW